MSYFLASLPIWALVALIVALPTALAMGLQASIHRWVGADRLAANNEIAGFKFATVGVIYAVLLAFTVIAVWEKFNEAQNAVAQEGAAIASLIRYSEGDEVEAKAFRNALVVYVRSVIENDWPAMGDETENHETTLRLNDVYHEALALGRSNTRDVADMSEVFTQLDGLTTARRVRLHLATGLVPNVIWIALFAGALLTIGFTLFFGSENLLAQVSMTGILSVLVTLGLVVIVSLDHPFTGPVHISPHAIEAVLADFAN